MKPPTEPTGSPGLVRALGPVMATAIVVGTVIGTGVFKKPQSVAEHVPYFGVAILVWVLGGVLALLGALAYAEVSVLLPRTGGNYVFLREAYGRLAGFLWGWVDFWIIRSATIAALATIFTESLNDLLADPTLRRSLALPAGSGLDFWTQRWVTAAVLAALTVVNILGVRWGGWLQLAVTLVKVATLLGIGILPFLVLGRSAATLAPVPLDPVWPSSWSAVELGGVGTAFLGVLWAYHGWMNVAPVAEEVRRPQRNIPVALLAGVGLVMALYVAANVAYYLVLPRAEMAQLKTTTVATAFCRQLVGPLGTALASGAVLFSAFGGLNGNILVGPRMLYAMGEDDLAPKTLGAIHPRFHTPGCAILCLGTWAIGLVLGVAVLSRMGWLEPGKSPFDRLSDYAMFGAVIFETLAVVSIFVFRRRWPDAPRPYRCPGYPVVPALYVLLPLFVLINMFRKQPAEALTGVAFIALGTMVYLAFGLGKVRPHAVSAARQS